MTSVLRIDDVNASSPVLTTWCVTCTTIQGVVPRATGQGVPSAVARQEIAELPVALIADVPVRVRVFLWSCLSTPLHQSQSLFIVGFDMRHNH